MSITMAGYDGARGYAFEQATKNHWRVLDVGGSAMPFMPGAVTMDIQSNAAYVGDICQPEVWELARKETWDMVVCSHTLEDVRDPLFALKQIATIAPRGYIETPHKHTEMSIIDRPDWPGYCHHRWIFCVQNNKLRMMAKWPVVAAFAPAGHAYGTIPWLDASKVRQGALQVWFENGIDFEIINGDFPGQAAAGCEGILKDYRDELAGGW